MSPAECPHQVGSWRTPGEGDGACECCGGATCDGGALCAWCDPYLEPDEDPGSLFDPQ